MAREARLNVQGLARRDAGLMRTILPEPGYTTVSIDLASGEPTVTGHFSMDPNYLYATYHGVGLAPYWEGGVLKIDDIYIMVMSVSPIGASHVKDAWSKQWPAGSFSDQWLADAEIIKKALGEQRKIHKILALGLGYGMGPAKMVKQMYESGYKLDLKTAKAFKDAYWRLFKGVRRLADLLSLQVEKEGQLINPFGYRLVPDKQKAYNYFIQSSVSGIMHVLCAKLFAIAPYSLFSTVIHDEIVCDVPTERLEEFRQHLKIATDSLNDDLQWGVKIRTGFAFGPSWFEAK